jgi:uncharacterized protein with ParB-like and HNH nuclease domain
MANNLTEPHRLLARPLSHTTVRWDVVDGQQRLATVMLTVRLLIDAYEQIQEAAAASQTTTEGEEAAAAQKTENQAKIAAKALRNTIVF